MDGLHTGRSVAAQHPAGLCVTSAPFRGIVPSTVQPCCQHRAEGVLSGSGNPGRPLPRPFCLLPGPALSTLAELREAGTLSQESTRVPKACLGLTRVSHDGAGRFCRVPVTCTPARSSSPGAALQSPSSRGARPIPLTSGKSLAALSGHLSPSPVTPTTKAVHVWNEIQGHEGIQLHHFI